MPTDELTTKPAPKPTLPILHGTAQAWECPVCMRANGIPEIDRCRCGAVLNGDGTVTPK